MSDLPPLQVKKLKSPNWGSSLFEEELHMNERALMVIVSCIDGYSEPINLDWPQDDIEEVVFSKWAAEELLNLVWDHPWTLASETIEAFALKMELYAAGSNSEQQHRIFSIAAKIAWELRDYIVEEVER